MIDFKTMYFPMPVRTGNCIFSFLPEVFQDILLMILFSRFGYVSLKDFNNKKSFSEFIAFPSIKFTNTRNAFFRYCSIFSKIDIVVQKFVFKQSNGLVKQRETVHFLQRLCSEHFKDFVAQLYICLLLFSVWRLRRDDVSSIL